ncbi:MAG: DNA recombination protein RmuC [Verrucomicrobia bacterium]|nr:DNA recombination protein RmuC [Verrucomicrobiota bacterium]
MIFTIVALASAALAGAFTWLFLRGRETARAAELAATLADRDRLTAELASARAESARLATLNSSLQADLAADRAKFAAQLAAEQQRLTEREALAAKYLADAEKLKATLQTEFQAVASKLLDEKSAKFTDHNKVQVEALLHPLRQQLADFRERVDTVYKTESDDRSALKAQIEQLRLLNTRITDEAHALTTALKGQSQARGAWGELILERLLESAGLIRGQDYLTQESITAADGRRLRPDVILRLPDQRHLVIDSKVSLVAYERAVNASDDPTRLASTRDHAAAVRTHVEQLSAKKYEDTGKLITPDYVLMFVPLEPAFILAVEHDRVLYEWAFDRRVILCTAPTLLVTLKTVASLWKQDRQTKNVQAIATRGGLLYDKFAGLFADLEDIGRHLARLRESYDGALGKLKTGPGNLLTQVEELKTLGAKAKKSLPAATPEIDG